MARLRGIVISVLRCDGSPGASSGFDVVASGRSEPAAALTDDAADAVLALLEIKDSAAGSRGG